MDRKERAEAGVNVLRSILLVVAMLGAALLCADEAPWIWSTTLPTELVTDSRSAHRTSAAAVEYFRNRKEMRAPLVAELLAHFGSPDGFTKQTIWNKNVDEVASATGGTLRFLLEDGSEFHAFAPDLKNVHFAFLYRPGKPMELLWK